MPITVTRTEDGAHITWERADDAHGRLSQAIDAEHLTGVLTALAAGPDGLTELNDSRALIRHTEAIARSLEKCSRALAVILREQDGLSWSELATELYDDPEKTSTARRVYAAGLRQRDAAEPPGSDEERTR